MAENKIIRRDIYWGMSEEAIRERVVQIALGLLGITEGTKEFEEKIRSIYNAQKPLPRGHVLSKTDAWCAAYITVVGILAEISDIILPECSCAKMIELYKAQGRWMEADDYVPKPGDLVMYDWDAKSGECTGAPDHVGMVVSVEDQTIRVIEGNYDNAVKCRGICIEYVKVRGYCLPDYAGLVQRFADVDPDAWYAKAVAKAAELGIVEGVGGGLFEPERAITRAEAAAMCVRLYEILNQ